MEGMPDRVSAAYSMTATTRLLAAYSVEIDCRAHTQRQHEEQRGQHDVDGVEDVRQDADGVAEVAGRGAQQLPAQVRHALDQHIARSGTVPARRSARRTAPSGPASVALQTRRRVEKFRIVHGSAPPYLRFRKKFSAALMSIMNRNSTSAMENSACRCRPAAA